MAQKRIILILFSVFALLSACAGAAVISGTVYDMSLDEVQDAVVKINTKPQQQKVAKNSTYFFSVPAGDYTISAEEYKNGEVVSAAEENITVEGDGEYVLDLILFPSFEKEEELLSEAEFEISEGVIESKTNYAALAVVVIAVAAFFVILRMRGKEIEKNRGNIEKEEKADLSRVLAFIEKEGGRTTQKEIRKNFPQSEAKISLIVAELEEKGKIKKIKKGRGNIIILSK